MPNLNWKEVQVRAIEFSRSWATATSEHADAQTFWNDFFAVFGRDRRTVASFEVAVRNIQGQYNYIDLLWNGVLLVEHKSAGKNLSAAESQAFHYIADLVREDPDATPPRYVILSDFRRFALYDLEPDDQKHHPKFAGIRFSEIHFPLSELHSYIRDFAFIKGERTVRLDPEDPANEKAYKRMSELHEALEAGGFTGTNLEKLLVRILFCLFAEDTEVFEPNTFSAFIRQHTREDGSDLGARLNELFHYLNTPRTSWPASIEETFGNFKYINGRLFADPLTFANFNRQMRIKLLEAADFQWAQVSPAVFGSLFQGILGDNVRRQQGAHYTSERDIMKVVRSLFLDDLRAEFDAIKADRSNRRAHLLDAFHDKLRSLRFFDPACGCGNFLVLAYRELRMLELELLHTIHSSGQRVLDVRSLIKVDVDQFFGIELAEWPVRIAEVALWLMDHQMNLKASLAFGLNCERLPLRSTPHIVQGNALRINWHEILPPSEGVYVLGNPPFVGKHYQNADQKADMREVYGEFKNLGDIDYVTCWFRKAAAYIQRTRIKVGFVATNSITQGEQVPIVWGILFSKYQIKIHFAHRTFSWVSEARGKAHVHVVIIGFAAFDISEKQLIDYKFNSLQPTSITVANISPYLTPGSDTFATKRTKPLATVPEIRCGNKPSDGGNLILSDADKAALLIEEPGAAKYLRRYTGAEEFINGNMRWCLWLTDITPSELRSLPKVMERVRKVKEFREKSSALPTRQSAAHPTHFFYINQPTRKYIIVPEVSSERRRYVPIGIVSPKVVSANTNFIVPTEDRFIFGVLTSAFHMAWLRTVGGRLKSDVRYSGSMVYNTYPWPTNPTDKHRLAVVTAAEVVLEARAQFQPPQGNCTLADLYDPLVMPISLVKAHAALDRAVDRCYRSKPFRSDHERVEHLFAQYEAITSPLLPSATTRRKKSSIDS